MTSVFTRLFGRPKTKPVQPPRKVDATLAITTPVFNGERFLDETIFSVVTQAGPFFIRYHVQDGGSSDGTLDILAGWAKRLESGDFPLCCGGIEFSYTSTKDAGPYDAVNQGFAFSGPADIMSWINSDDRYLQGAFASVVEIFGKFKDVRWIGSRPVLMTEAGTPGELVDLRGFPQKAIAAGIFEGRFAPFFLQQEGMFWRSDLWKQVGGVNSRLRLAGDFDLWRRFAKHTDLVMADALLGCFRVRQGQLSASIDDYRGEIDAVLTEADKSEREKMSGKFREATTEQAIRAGQLQSRFAINRVFAGGWHVVARP